MKPLHKKMIRLAIQRPRIIQTLLRLAYRQKIGAGYDRWKRTGKSGMPCEVKIHLTRRCNLSCIMCGQHRHSKDTDQHIPWCNPDNELPIDIWKNFMDQMASWSSTGYRPWLDISGGEPTIYPHFKEFITHARKHNFFINLLTNGTTLEKNVSFLIDQAVDAVTISIDGPEKHHDSIRGMEGLFKRVKKGIRALIEERERRNSLSPVISLTCTISHENLAVLEQMIPIAEELGVDSIVFNNTSFQSQETVTSHNSILNQELAQRENLQVILPSIPEGGYYKSEIEEADIPTLVQAISTLHAMEKKSPLRVAFAPFSMKSSLLKPYYLDMSYPFPDICDFLWKSIRIHPDGTVSPCLGFMAGNIRSNTVKEVWNGAAYRKFRSLVTKNIFPGCARCCQRRYTEKVKLGFSNQN